MEEKPQVVSARRLAEALERVYSVSFRTFCLMQGFNMNVAGSGPWALAMLMGISEYDAYDLMRANRVYGKVTSSDLSEMGGREAFVSDRSAAWIFFARTTRPDIVTELIKSNIGYLWSRASSWARSYGGRFGPRELLGSASVGMNRAVEIYDFSKSCPFLPYARMHIDHEIRKQMNEDGKCLHVPRTKADGVEVHEIRLDGLTDHCDIGINDEKPDIVASAEVARIRLVMSRLSEWERKVLRLKYGFDGTDKSDAELARVLDITLSYATYSKKYSQNRARALYEVSEGVRSRYDVPPPLGPPSKKKSRRQTVVVQL